MIIVETWALIYNVNNFITASNWLLSVIGIILLIFELWMIVESLNVYKKFKSGELVDQGLGV